MRWLQRLLLVCVAIEALATIAWAEPLEPLLKIAPGFAIERVYVVPREAQGSWVSLCSDPRGVLYASDQYGPLYRIELPSANGDVSVRALSLPIGGAHGLTWIDEELYAVVGQREVCQPGLYRLRDTDGDRELDDLRQLQTFAADGEHAPHAVAVSTDGQSLYLIAGNATPLPKLDRSRVPPNWRDDSLLPPLPALVGSETRGLPHGGWICRTDRDGREWELICMGFRNAYALACNGAGELFTFDSDTEFDIGMPWYRPTRVLHCLSGADFGWRRGALKVPDGAPDTLPPLVTLGLGSPTAVLCATGTKFPPAYQDALFVADWSFGRLIAIHLKPAGAGFSADAEEIVAGTPLPITAACVNARDGALYFVTGGRKTQSILYRLKWADTKPPMTNSAVVAVPDTTGVRRTLETFQGRLDPQATDAAWPYLASEDSALRHAARIAIESQPVMNWQDRALSESNDRAALVALLALTRTGDASLQPRILARLEAMEWERLGSQKQGWLRVVNLAFCRLGAPAADARQQWIDLLSPRFPSRDPAVDAALCELLVYLAAPGIAAKTMPLLAEGTTREQQIQYARYLSHVREGWTPELRQEYFDWFGRASAWRGGASFAPFMQRIRADALAAAPEDERPGLMSRMQAAQPTAERSGFALPAGRSRIKQWQLAELLPVVESAGAKSEPERGRRWFTALCAACHTFGGYGGAIGSDLTNATRRLSTRDLLEAIVDPSKEISDQYGTVVITRRDGSEVQGRVVNYTPGAVHVSQNLFDPAAVMRVPEGEIDAIRRSKISLMPVGLLDVLEAGEIMDLLAYLGSPPDRP